MYERIMKRCETPITYVDIEQQHNLEIRYKVQRTKQTPIFSVAFWLNPEAWKK